MPPHHFKTTKSEPQQEIPINAIKSKLDLDDFRKELAPKKTPELWMPIDSFGSKKDFISSNLNKDSLDIDGDGKPDINHGKLVSYIIKASGREVVGFNIDGNPRLIDLRGKDDSIQEKLTKLFHSANEAPITGLNLSLALHVTFSELSKCTGLVINAENVAQKRGEIVDRLQKLTKSNSPQTLTGITCNGGNLRYAALQQSLEFISLLEKISGAGHPVVIAAGNNGPNELNLLSLAKGTTTVGGLDSKTRKPHPDSGNNSLVKAWEPYSIKAVATKQGVDISGDGIADIPWKETSTKGKFPTNLEIAPQNVVDKIAEKHDQRVKKIIADVFQEVELKTGIYRPSELYLERSVPAGSLVFFKNSNPAEFGLISPEIAKKLSASQISRVNAETKDRIGDSNFGEISNKEYIQIAKASGLKPGSYDFEDLDSRVLKKKQIQLCLHGGSEALQIKQFGRSGFVDTAKTVEISGTSFSAPAFIANGKR